MAMSESVTDGSDGGRSRVGKVFAWIDIFTEEGSRASLPLRELGFGLPSCSSAALRSGADVGPDEVRAAVTIIERRDSGKDNERYDQVMGLVRRKVPGGLRCAGGNRQWAEK
ncbi:hypothetical protein EDB83DRAFT_2316345 [Lactarius deliciosus]|nr:hypothetical protein EDB83DRAFT_2316345 [Lactarius deliciosus]